MNIHLNDYCERLGVAGLAAEPLNVASNLGFIIAAALAFRACKRLQLKSHLDIYALCLTMLLIGLGSGAWHLQPSDVTLMMDIIPITAFINLYLASLLRRKFTMKWGYIALVFALLHKANYVANTAFAPSFLNGTILYLPTWLMLAAICACAVRCKLPFAKELIVTSGLWSVSLGLRTIDFAACGAHPFGTHFLWHILNALVLYKLLKILLK